MPPSPLTDRPPTKIVASTATLHDLFPRTTEFELQGGQRPFTIFSREAPVRGVEQSALLYVTSEGVLHELQSKDGEFRHNGTPYVIEELRGGVVIRMTATRLESTQHTYVVVTGRKSEAAGGEAVVVALELGSSGWTRAAVPLDAQAMEAIAGAVASGFAVPAKVPVYHAARPAESRPSLFAFGFHGGGTVAPIGIGRLPEFTEGFRIIALASEHGDTMNLASVAVNTLFIHAPRAGEGPVVFDEQSIVQRYDMPLTSLVSTDASYLTPINDERGQCHGMFVRSFDNDLYGTLFDPDRDILQPMTGREGGPARVIDVTYSFYGDGNLHVFALDAAHSVWYANCPKGTDLADVTWQPTGQYAVNLEAPPVMGERPYVIDGRQDRLDQLVAGAAGEVWTRVNFPIAEPRPDAVPAVVHRITLSVVNDQGQPSYAMLSVRAERPVIVEQGGILHELRPDRTMAFWPNSFGRVALRVRGTGIDIPALFVHSPQIPGLPEQRFQAEASALHRLTGTDPAFQVTGASLMAAGLLPAMPMEKADRVAATFREAAQASAGNRDAAFRGAAAETSVTIVRTSAGFRVADGGSNAFRSTLDGDIASTAAAFWQWVRGAWDTIRDFTVSVVQGVATLVATGVDRIMSLITDAARYIADGMHAVIAMLNQLGEDLVDAGRKVVEWVAETLGWDDVVRCKDVVRDYTAACLSDLETLVGQTLPSRASQAIQSLQRDVDRFFERAIGEPRIQEGRTHDPAEIRSMEATTRVHGSKMTLVHDALPGEPLPEATFELSPGLREKIDALARQAETLADSEQLRSQLAALDPIFAGKTSIQEAVQLGLGEVLRILQPLVKIALQAADVVQTLLFEILAGVIAAFRRLLTTPVASFGGPFEWLDSLYRAISGGQPLTLIDLASLLFVMPGVIAHHIVTGRPVLDPGTAVPAMTPTFVAATSSVLFGPAANDAAEDPDRTITEAQSVFRIVEAVTLAVAGAYFFLFRMPFSLVDNTARLSAAKLMGFATTVTTTVVMILDFAAALWLVGRWFVLLALPYRESIETILGLSAASVATVVLVGVLAVLLGIRFALSVPGWFRVLLGAAVVAANGIVMFWAHLIWIIIWSVLRAPTAPEPQNARFYFGEFATLLFCASRLLTFGIPVGAKSPEGVSKTALIASNYAGDVAGYILLAGAAFSAVPWEVLTQRPA